MSLSLKTKLKNSLTVLWPFGMDFAGLAYFFGEIICLTIVLIGLILKIDNSEFWCVITLINPIYVHFYF